MNFLGFEKTDRRILITALVVLLLSAGLILNERWIYRLVQTEDADLRPIGSVKTSNRDVRRRHESALSWLPLDKAEEIYQGDSIFTGEDSSTIIVTERGEEISVAPNSLVVVKQTPDSITINIGFGSVEGKIEKGKKLYIASNNKITELKGDNATIRVDVGEGNKLLLNVMSGEVKIGSSGQEKVLRQDDTTEIQDNGHTAELIAKNIQLLNPLKGQIFKNSDDRPIIFKWKSSRKLSRTKIQISTNANFTNTIVNNRVDDNSYSAYNLPKDVDLYWQIIAEGGVSATNSFALVGDQPPNPVSPRPGQHIFYDNESDPNIIGSPIRLSWVQGSMSRKYEVQLAESANFDRNTQLFKTSSLNVDIGLVGRGTYYWRLRAIDFPNQRWSATSMFSVGPKPSKILAAPIPLLADNTILLKTKLNSGSNTVLSKTRSKEVFRNIENFPLLRWTLVPQVKRYTIQISRNSEFTDLVINKKILGNQFQWRQPEPGIYYWRTKAQHPDFKSGTPSQRSLLIVKVQPPDSLSNSPIIEEVPDIHLLEAPPPPQKLSWTPTIFTSLYEVEFSSRSDFKNSRRFVEVTTETDVRIPKPGVYFWRVRSLDSRNRPLSPFSATYNLEFQRVYRDPTKNLNLLALYPKQQDSIVFVGQSKPQIDFKWTKPYGDAQYRIELSYDPGFENVFHSASTKESYYTYQEPFNKNVVYWRIGAERADYPIDWTIPSRFVVSYEKAPFSFEHSEAMFAARIRAQERQKDWLLAQQRRLALFRSPASYSDIRLDTPQIQNPLNQFVVESNFSMATQDQSIRQRNERWDDSQIRELPTIRWQKVLAAERYFIEIAHDPEFKRMITKAPSWDPYFTWEAVRPGQFYYRIKAFNDHYLQSHYSQAQPLQVTVPSPKPTSPDNFVEIFDEPREMWQPPKPFVLTWTSVVFARSYEVEFSERPDFREAKIFNTIGPSAQFSVSKPGLYYWRVRPLNEHQIGIGPFSYFRSVEIIQTRRSPASVDSLAGVFPIERTMIFVGKGLMNLAFHWRSKDTSKAEIEVSSSPRFDKIIARATSRKGPAVVARDLPEGTLFWRVRSGSQLSSVYQFILQREREPYTPTIKANKAP